MSTDKLKIMDLAKDHSSGKIYIEDGFIILNVRYPYEISLEQIDTREKAAHWIMHLLDKNWMTRELLHEFVSILEKHFKYDLHTWDVW